MGSVNKVIIVGNLGADPETRYTADGKPVTTMRVATSEKWTDRDGHAQEKTEWHRIVVWGKQAEHCSQYLSKGRSVYLEGRLQTREWEDKEGVKRFTTEVVADRVVFLGGGSGDSARQEGDAGSRGNAGGGRGRAEHRDQEDDQASDFHWAPAIHCHDRPEAVPPDAAATVSGASDDAARAACSGSILARRNRSVARSASTGLLK